MAASPRPLWLRLLGLALVVHLLFCVQRVETNAVPKRLEHVELIHDKGMIHFHLRRLSPESIPVLEFIEEHTPADAMVLFRGEARGLLELAAALLSPRLLYQDISAPAGAKTIHGRPVAHVTHPKLGTGTLVLVLGEMVDGREVLELSLR